MTTRPRRPAATRPGARTVESLARWSLVLLSVLSTSAGAADYAAAYLESGFGPRAAGMGNAFSALVDGPTAAYWNPAGLAALRGRALAADYQPLSLDRTLASLSAAANLRGGFGFGFIWAHAGVDGLQGRTNSGEVFGDIEDSENAAIFGLGLAPAPGLRVGAAVKILRQSIDVAQVGGSSATGRGLDLGLQYDPGPQVRLALGARNLMARLKWTVARPSSQTGTSEDDLAAELYAGAAHQPLPGLWLAADARLGDVGAKGALGLTWQASPLLTLRAGLSRIGEADGVGSAAAGLSVRPMRNEAFELHYAYTQDPLDAGGRVTLGLSARF